jgi:hypothetical protein
VKKSKDIGGKISGFQKGRGDMRSLGPSGGRGGRFTDAGRGTRFTMPAGTAFFTGGSSTTSQGRNIPFQTA